MNKKVKVLRILNRFNLGGPTYNAAYLTKYLGDPFDTVLIGGEKDESEGSSLFITDKIGLHPIIIKSMRRAINPYLDYKAYLEIKSIINREKPDIVHTHASKAGFLGRLAAFHSNVPITIHTFHGHVFHSYFGFIKTWIYKSIERYLAKKTTAIVAISERQKEELVDEHKICDSKKVTIIPLGFDLKKFTEKKNEKRIEFRNQYNLANDEFAIGIIGRLVPVKNHKLFLEAWTTLKCITDKKIRAFVIGDGEMKKELIQFANERNLTTNFSNTSKPDIYFCSWIKDVDIAYAGLDIVCLTSFNEGTPVSLIEAQAAGKPVISTKVGGIKNVVSENKTGILIKNDNVVELVVALKKFLDNPELIKQFGLDGWKVVGKYYHYNTLISNLKAFYLQLLNENTI